MGKAKFKVGCSRALPSKPIKIRTEPPLKSTKCFYCGKDIKDFKIAIRKNGEIYCCLSCLNKIRKK